MPSQVFFHYLHPPGSRAATAAIEPRCPPVAGGIWSLSIRTEPLGSWLIFVLARFRQKPGGECCAERNWRCRPRQDLLLGCLGQAGKPRVDAGRSWPPRGRALPDRCRAPPRSFHPMDQTAGGSVHDVAVSSCRRQAHEIAPATSRCAPVSRVYCPARCAPGMLEVTHSLHPATHRVILARGLQVRPRWALPPVHTEQLFGSARRRYDLAGAPNSLLRLNQLTIQPRAR